MSEFKKNDTGKPQLSRVPSFALESVAKVLAFGAEKYGWENWRKCEDVRRYYDAALRHTFAASRGEFLDEESGLPHLSHALCCLMFALELETELRP